METKGQSILGTVSLLLALLPAVIIIILYVSAIFYSAYPVPLYIPLILLFYSLPPSIIFGFITGIAGMRRKKRRRQFALWGTIISAFNFLLTVVFLIIQAVFL
jgi:hypothetical protein